MNSYAHPGVLLYNRQLTNAHKVRAINLCGESRWN